MSRSTQSSLYLKSLYHFQLHYTFIDKLKESIEQSYEQYKNADYQDLMNDMNPPEIFICPRCHAEFLLNLKEINDEFKIMECPSCHFVYCSACDQSMESHMYSDQYFFCNASTRCYCRKDNINSISIWPLKYQHRQKVAIWNELNQLYMNEKELLDTLNTRFFVDKDKNSENEKFVSLSKLCLRTRIARVFLRDITDRNLVKEKTMEILNTIIHAQSIIMSAYPTLFFINDDIVKTESLREKVDSLKQETDSFIALLDHPERSSTNELQQKVESMQKIIDDILEFSEQELKHI